MSKIIKAVALFVGLGVAQNAVAANLLQNGGFETPVQQFPDFASFNVPKGSNLITDWTVVQGNVDLTTNADYGPGINTLDTASKQDIDLIGDTNGSNGVKGGLSQTFATTAGQLYKLTFDYSHNNGTFSPDYAAQVTLADALTSSTIVTFEVAQNFGAAPWVASSTTFTATSDSTLLSFIDTRGAFNAGVYLDDVDVEAVRASTTPLPGALPLLISGVGGMVMLARRKQKKAAAIKV
jgi:hypothetical protein